MTTPHTVHPYFTAKAREVFTAADGDPAHAGPLAAWAQKAHDDGPDSRRRVIVAADGGILGEARHVQDRIGASYVTSVTDPADEDLVNREVGLARGAFSRRHGQPVIVVTYSQVCTGPRPRS